MKKLNTILVLLIIFLGCSKNESPGSKEYKPGIDKSDKASDLIKYKKYFPLAKGNSWSYKCTIKHGREPLYSFNAEIEVGDSTRGHKRGDIVWYSGRCINAKSGIETYSIFKYDPTLDAFCVSVSKGVMDNRKYDLGELINVYWRYNEYGVWEVVRARHLSETVLVGGFIAFLKPGEGQKEVRYRQQKVICEVSLETIDVPAGTYSNCLKNITTQLGGLDFEMIKNISYFAQNVGLVKEIQYDANGVEIYRLELISYSHN